MGDYVYYFFRIRCLCLSTPRVPYEPHVYPGQSTSASFTLLLSIYGRIDLLQMTTAYGSSPCLLRDTPIDHAFPPYWAAQGRPSAYGTGSTYPQRFGVTLSYSPASLSTYRL
ncbi:hypothetical protein BDV59DRAFT_29352 [Aspergillus ambiguus]|uniref:uncharacterized protein n=1 Tax=Aspergillus ambiguus TaxID=176160 RepID=UPI003CCD27B2